MGYCHQEDCAEEIPAGTRADAIYCSNACRQRAYRRHQAESREIRVRYGDDPEVGFSRWLAEVEDAFPVTDTESTSRNGVSP